MRRPNAGAFRRLWADRNGVTAVMTAIAAVGLMGFAGLAIDVVSWELTEHRMQTAADEAALAGAIAESANENITSAVDAVAATYGFVNNQKGVTISVNPNYNNAEEVQVQISQTQNQYFSRLFLNTAPTLTMQAVALPLGPQNNGEMCVLALADSGKLEVGSVAFPSNTNVNLDCELYNDSTGSNSTELSGGSTLTALDMYLSGGYTLDNNATLSVSGTLATYITPTPDPYSAFSVTSNGGVMTVYDPDSGKTMSASTCNQGSLSQGWAPATMTVSPTGSTPYVICGGLTVNSGVTLTLNPGTYIINSGGLTVNGGATLTGTGVTIILTSSVSASDIGTIKFNGNSTETLTAPAVGSTAGLQGMAIWIDKNAAIASDNLTGGGTQIINGAIYMPTQNVTYAGGSTQTINNMFTGCSQLVALTVTFSGGSYFSHSYCSAWDLPVKNPLAPPKLAS